MLIDMHAHTSGISPCCRVNPTEVILACKQRNINAIVLTNHYSCSYVETTATDLAKAYVKEYEITKEIGEKNGVKVFFGIEITMQKHNDAHLLLYGVDTDFLLKNPEIFNLTQEELFNLANENNAIVVQAHPLRKKGLKGLLDLKFLHGLELNSHLLYEGPQYEIIKEIAFENNLLLTSGGDYHGDTPRSECGVLVNGEVNDIKDIVNYLIKEKQIYLRFQNAENLSAQTELFVKKI